ncbi:TPA: hypothetical protein ACGJ0L_004186 [Pseudomonas aeruginosa]|uniref:hypothetical protein n=4 Tax=Pseudomonas aeruginosa TaxID=287 RepID=UPI00192B98C6|nr:hypothetical protein [Pseudomonas aeruginosa]
MNKALAEQAGGDERAAFERAFTVQEGIYFDDKRGEYRSMNLCAIEASDAQDLNLQLQGWQARAALAQPSPMYDPKRCLACGGDHGNSGLPCPNMRVTAQAQPSPKCVKCGGTGEADSGGVHPWGEPVLIPCDCETEQAVAERPEVVAYADPVAFATFKERGHEGGVAGREWMWAEPGAALVAMSRTDECERIVGALREQYECNTAIMHARTEALSRVTSERDAALSRVAELEKQEPVATVAKVPGEDWNSLDFHRDLQDMQPGTKLYAAPVAQAQHSVPDHAELLQALERTHAGHMVGHDQSDQPKGGYSDGYVNGFGECIMVARKVLAASPAQAQHSVPETTNEDANSFLRVADAGQFKDNAAAVRTAAMIIRGLLHRPAIMKSIIRHRIGLTPEYEGQWHADLYGEDGEVQHHAEADTPDEAVRAVVALAAAPGKEVPQAWLDVQAERRRQITAEGWTPEHDDGHACDEIAAFACYYAMPPAVREWDASSTGYGDTLGEAVLPEGWEPKTGDRRRDLIKACALALAEIERLDRAAPGKEGV